MKHRKMMIGTIIIVLVSALLFNACAPLREFGNSPVYKGANDFTYNRPFYDSSKKTVIVVANNDGTELFDMMGPYYLFNATQKANVYIAAKNKVPIVVKKGFFVLPQLTFAEVDSLKIKPDVIVIPFLSAADSVHQDPTLIKWIKDHYSSTVNVLSVCDGAATAAATGLFDGKPITAHASDYAGIKPHFSKPLWIQNTSVASSGNLYSTAGVSNATEGSLLVIEKLFGVEIMKNVIADVAYPSNTPKLQHQSVGFQFGDKAAVGKKILFKRNKRVGVIMQEGANEFELAAVMDTYNRTFPKSIESFTLNDLPIKTKHGLTIIPTGQLGNSKLDELHVVEPFPLFPKSERQFNGVKVIRYNGQRKDYIIDACLARITNEYGGKFNHVVKLMLDYN